MNSVTFKHKIKNNIKGILFWGLIILIFIGGVNGIIHDHQLESKVDYLIETHNIDPKVFE